MSGEEWAHNKREGRGRVPPRHVTRELPRAGTHVGKVGFGDRLAPAIEPVIARRARKAARDQLRLTARPWATKPKPEPRSERTMTGLRPTRSESVGQRKRPKSIPIGYADVSQPSDAPTSRPKCAPERPRRDRAGHHVKPRRLRKAARRTANTERSSREKRGSAASRPPWAAAAVVRR